MKSFPSSLYAERWINNNAVGPVSVLVVYTYGRVKYTFEPFGTLGWSKREAA